MPTEHDAAQAHYTTTREAAEAAQAKIIAAIDTFAMQTMPPLVAALNEANIALGTAANWIGATGPGSAPGTVPPVPDTDVSRGMLFNAWKRFYAATQ